MILNQNKRPEGDLKVTQDMSDSIIQIVSIITQYPPEEQNLLIRKVRDNVRQERENLIAKMEGEVSFIRNTIREI
jgi:hypothetical protein